MPRHSAPQQPAWLRPRLVVTLAVATAGLATAVWLPTRNDSADASERDRDFNSAQRRDRDDSLDAFADDFSGDAGSPADPQKWVLETSRSRNARLDGEGNLLLTAREGSRRGLPSVRLVSTATFRREAGEVSARIRVPEGEGLKPSFELVGAGRRGSGSIDLLAEPVGEGFHTYGLAWTPDTVTFTIDGDEVRRVPAAETDLPFRLALSLTVTDGRRAELPARMAVDFVSVGDDAAQPSAPPSETPPSEEPPSEEPTAPPTEEPTTPPATTVPPSPEPTTPPTSEPAKQAWKPFTDYVAGQVVTFQGADYEVLETHTSLPGWEPTALPNLFKKI